MEKEEIKFAWPKSDVERLKVEVENPSLVYIYIKLMRNIHIGCQKEENSEQVIRNIRNGSW